MNDCEAIKVIISQLERVIRGEPLEKIEWSEITAQTGISTEMHLLVHVLNDCLEKHIENFTFTSELAKGMLDAAPPMKNVFAAPSKQIQSNLKHLTWQIQQIEKENYSPSIDFMGDFSSVFNSLIVKLKDRKHLQEKLRKSEVLFRSVINMLPDGVVVVDPTGIITFISPAALHIFHYLTIMDPLGKNLYEVIHEDDRERGIKNSKDRLLGKFTGAEEYKAIRSDGSVFDVEIDGEVLRDELDNITGGVYVVRDITDRKESDRQLKRYMDELAELNDAKDKFFTIIAHDLKGPIGSLPRVISHIEKQNDISPETRDMLAIVRESSQSMSALLEDLLEWARSQRGEILFSPEPILLQEVIQKCLRLFTFSASQKNIQMAFEGTTDYSVYADEEMVVTVIRNLISNAIKFTKPNGEIKLSAVQKGKLVEITVADNGVGIAPQKVSRLFKITEKVSTTGTGGEHGTGLGLILCKEFVEKNGGTIRVKSTLGVGSCFSFTLPGYSNTN